MPRSGKYVYYTLRRQVLCISVGNMSHPEFCNNIKARKK